MKHTGLPLLTPGEAGSQPLSAAVTRHAGVSSHNGFADVQELTWRPQLTGAHFIGPVFVCWAGGSQWSKTFRERFIYSFFLSLKLPTQSDASAQALISEPPQRCLFQGWCLLLCEAKANSIKANHAMQTSANSLRTVRICFLAATLMTWILGEKLSKPPVLTRQRDFLKLHFFISVTNIWGAF